MESNPNYHIIKDDTKYSKDLFNISDKYKPFISHIMIPSGLIKDRVKQLAKTIYDDYHNKNVVFVPVLKGASRFFNDLSYFYGENELKDKTSFMDFDTNFANASSYQGTKSTGELKVNFLSEPDFKNKHVIIVEDIVDTGLTMAGDKNQQGLISVINDYGAASVDVASLLVKRTSKSNGYKPGYVGFSIPDHFVVGYDLDYNEHFRKIKSVCVLNQSGIDKFAKK